MAEGTGQADASLTMGHRYRDYIWPWPSASSSTHTKAIWMRIIMGKSAYGSSGPAQRGLSFSGFLGPGQLSETLRKSGILLRRKFVLLTTTTSVVTCEDDDVVFNSKQLLQDHGC